MRSPGHGDMGAALTGGSHLRSARGKAGLLPRVCGSLAPGRLSSSHFGEVRVQTRLSKGGLGPITDTRSYKGPRGHLRVPVSCCHNSAARQATENPEARSHERFSPAHPARTLHLAPAWVQDCSTRTGAPAGPCASHSRVSSQGQPGHTSLLPSPACLLSVCIPLATASLGQGHPKQGGRLPPPGDYLCNLPWMRGGHPGHTLGQAQGEGTDVATSPRPSSFQSLQASFLKVGGGGNWLSIPVLYSSAVLNLVPGQALRRGKGDRGGCQTPNPTTVPS